MALYADLFTFLLCLQWNQSTLCDHNRTMEMDEQNEMCENTICNRLSNAKQKQIFRFSSKIDRIYSYAMNQKRIVKIKKWQKLTTKVFIVCWISILISLFYWYLVRRPPPISFFHLDQIYFLNIFACFL